VTAVVAFNDYVSQDAVQYALEQQLVINKDTTFVSYANLPLRSYMAYPPIASVEQYPYQQGQKATEILLELLSGKNDPDTFHTVTLDSHLVLAGKR
jgi:LacI family transcriptional regulator